MKKLVFGLLAVGVLLAGSVVPGYADGWHGGGGLAAAAALGAGMADGAPRWSSWGRGCVGALRAHAYAPPVVVLPVVVGARAPPVYTQEPAGAGTTARIRRLLPRRCPNARPSGCRWRRSPSEHAPRPIRAWRGDGRVINRSAGFLLVAVVPLLGACVTVPGGPSVMVLPGSGKPFEVFQADDDSCRQWASHRSGRVPNEPVTGGVHRCDYRDPAWRGARRRHRRRSRQSGPGRGRRCRERFFFGTATGASADAQTGMSMQQRYDTAYTQCMYAKGNQIPGLPLHGHLVGRGTRLLAAALPAARKCPCS